MTSYISLVTIPICYLRRKEIYAIIQIGGKQYKVTPGQIVQVDLLAGNEGESIELDRVLLIADNEKVTVGAPVINGAKVTAVIGTSGRGNKIIVGKFKAKNRYKKKSGHRQDFTSLTIGEIASGSKS